MTAAAAAMEIVVVRERESGRSRRKEEAVWKGETATEAATTRGRVRRGGKRAAEESKGLRCSWRKMAGRSSVVESLR
jgi:hypothetical protein